MIVLGIDTSTSILDIAIADHNEVIANCQVKRKEITHSAMIIGVIQSTLSIAGLELKKIEGISVSIGPGSFTGLRIGLSVGKGLAFALSIPIVGVNTLEAFASDWMTLNGLLCPVIRARKGEYYFSLFQGTEGRELVRKRPYQCASWQQIQEVLQKEDQIIYLFGSDIAEILEQIEESSDLEKIIPLVNQGGHSIARNTALLGEIRLKQNKSDYLYTLLPFYLCKSAAEINLSGEYYKGKMNER